MSKFESWKSYWKFSKDVKTQSRYFLSEESQRFLSTVMQLCKKNEVSIKKGSVFCRSQKGYEYRWVQDDKGNDIYEEETALCPERMIPLKNKAREGRANPKGIPYLYLSANENTALAEYRPWVSALFSLGYFEVTKNLVLVDFTSEKKSTTVYLKEPPDEKVDDIVWQDINGAFSRPVTNSDDTADYVPTQVIAEMLRKQGYDGIVYKSSLGKGNNILLFDLNLVRQVSGYLFNTRTVEFTFELEANPYYIPKKK